MPRPSSYVPQLANEQYGNYVVLVEATDKETGQRTRHIQWVFTRKDAEEYPKWIRQDYREPIKARILPKSPQNIRKAHDFLWKWRAN